MITSAINSGLSAMNAFSTGVHGSAYNLANVNTSGFTPVAVHYRSGPVSVSGLSGQAGLETGVRPVVSRPAPSANGASQSFQPSRTDVAREMVNLTENQHAFNANAQVIRASDEMLGGLVDMIV